MSKPVDMLNKVFGRLTVTRRSPKNTFGHKFWYCECECGNSIEVDGGHLRSGNTQSCGCLRSDTTTQRSTVHGHSKREQKSDEYICWRNIKQRCFSPSNKEYHNYGGRGITMCDDWLDFNVFIKDMGKKPTSKHTIERINVNGNYTKDNCCWATTKQQAKNRRNTHIIEYKGKKLSLPELSTITGIKRRTLNYRLNKGWPIEKIVAGP